MGGGSSPTSPVDGSQESQISGGPPKNLVDLFSPIVDIHIYIYKYT